MRRFRATFPNMSLIHANSPHCKPNVFSQLTWCAKTLDYKLPSSGPAVRWKPARYRQVQLQVGRNHRGGWNVGESRDRRQECPGRKFWMAVLRTSATEVATSANKIKLNVTNLHSWPSLRVWSTQQNALYLSVIFATIYLPPYICHHIFATIISNTINSLLPPEAYFPFQTLSYILTWSGDENVDVIYDVPHHTIVFGLIK